MARHSDARQKMLTSAVLLFRERGLPGTSLSDIVEHSGAPRGSLYHYFPGGKAQLATEATEFAGSFISAAITEVLEHSHPVDALRMMVEFYRVQLRDSAFESGCPIGAAAFQGEEGAEAREAAGRIFEAWQELLTANNIKNGLPADRAASVATAVLATIQGALLMAKAQRTTQPLDRTETELVLQAEQLFPRS
ncbi:TetR/AcrR family transcriptional regulator [Pseudonocardiaceae bacterium YIM PH 21723]|nr:TetR/AcrR family transcriptional regulator [Pseudonocardiaceae bacterium YIM PH 21723]